MSASDPLARARPCELTIADGAAIAVKPGSRVLDVCEEHNLAVDFGCRDGACGTCVVRILSGMQFLSKPSPQEQILLEEVANDEPDVRLACQIVMHGPVHIRGA